MKALQKSNKDINDKLDAILSNNMNTPIKNAIHRDIKLPFENIDEFLKFSKLLEEKQDYRDFFVRIIRCNIILLLLYSLHIIYFQAKSISILINNNLSISRNIVTILRKYFKKDVITQFTAVKKTKDKQIFIKTNFCKELFGK